MISTQIIHWILPRGGQINPSSDRLSAGRGTIIWPKLQMFARWTFYNFLANWRIGYAGPVSYP